MKKELSLRLSPPDAIDETKIAGIIARKMSVSPSSISGFNIIKRSIDARMHPVKVQLQVVAWVGEPKPMRVPSQFDYPNVKSAPEVIVVGAGPAGLFAALKLVELGLKPIVIERGKDVSERKKDVALLNRNNPPNPESNYAFGEGGAGTFSDGKLYTRSVKRGNIYRFLEILNFNGASDDILIDAHPHVGSDRLPGIIKSIRDTIIAAGGEVLFNTRVNDLVIQGDEVTGVVTTSAGKIKGHAVILATGHSAGDIYTMLHHRALLLEPKAWAMGVRVEHPQRLIDQIQYHAPGGRGNYLPPATYSFSCQVKDRGVYSFCMCPGGFIVPAMTSPGEMVVNGMSASGRNSPFANSGMVVEVQPSDLIDYEKHGPLAGLAFQREIEKAFFVNGGGNVVAPAQRLTDFVRGRLSVDLPETSYLPGLVPAPLHTILPGFISKRLQDGFVYFGKQAKGFLDNEAIVVGVESRTSSPVRIPRHPVSLQHPQLKHLFPSGEGAGYAGGIASSALDGERVATMVASALGVNPG